MQVMGQGRIVVHYEIQSAAAACLALALAQFVDSLDHLQFREKRFALT
jgi:hypothetical protein